MSTVEPVKGLRFLHARRILGSPKAGTARPEPHVVTSVRAHVVYYRALDEQTGEPVGTSWHCDRERFPAIVKAVLT